MIEASGREVTLGLGNVSISIKFIRNVYLKFAQGLVRVRVIVEYLGEKRSPLNVDGNCGTWCLKLFTYMIVIVK